MGFTDDTDASRITRKGFTDVPVVYQDTRQFMERCFLMDESHSKGHQAWICQMALSLVQSDPAAMLGNFTALL